MADPRNRMWSVAAGALTLPGLVLGHVLAYVIAYPSAPEKALHLGNHSHGPFPGIVLIAFLVLPLALGAAALHGLRSERRVPLWRTAVALGWLQCSAFTLLELVERGLHLTETITDPAVGIGALIQIPLAAVLIYLLAAFVHRVRRLVRVRTTPSWTAQLRLQQPPAEPGRILQAFFRRSLIPRAPPVPATA